MHCGFPTRPRKCREGVPAISGTAEPIAFDALREKLVRIACFRHGLTQADAQGAFQNAVLAWNESAGASSGEEDPIRAFLPTFHEKCVEQIGPRTGERVPSTLLAILQRREGRRALSALSRISPESRRAFRALLER